MKAGYPAIFYIKSICNHIVKKSTLLEERFTFSAHLEMSLHFNRITAGMTADPMTAIPVQKNTNGHVERDQNYILNWECILFCLHFLYSNVCHNLNTDKNVKYTG